MAFDFNELAAVVDGLGGGTIRVFSYVTADAFATVTAAGYFTLAAHRGLRAGDIVLVYDSATGGHYTLNVNAIAADLSATVALSEDALGTVFVTPQMYGATGAGYPTDDRAAFQLALDSGRTVLVPLPVNGVNGHYYVNGSLTYPTGATVIGINKPKIVMRNQGGRGNYIGSGVSRVRVENLWVHLHGNLARVLQAHYTAGSAGFWIGDVYPPSNVDESLARCEDVIVRNCKITSEQYGPDGVQNTHSVHGIACWGNTRNVLCEHLDIRGRYINYFINSDWGTSRPRKDQVTGAVVEPYDDIWHPRGLTFRDIYIEGDYTWVFPSGPSAGLPVAPNGISFSNAQQVRCERITIKDVSEAFWIKLGDAGTAPDAVPVTDMPYDTELAGFHVSDLYIENARQFGVQVSNKSYDHNVAGISTYGTDVPGISILFENCTFVRGPTEHAKGCLWFSAFWTANVTAKFDIVHPSNVTLTGTQLLASPIRLFNAKNIKLSGNWQCIGRAVEARGVIGLNIDGAKIINPSQDRDAAYAWPLSTIGVNLIATRSLASDGPSTTLAANYTPAPEDNPTEEEVEAASNLSLASLPWALADNDTIFVGDEVISVVGEYDATGSPATIRIVPHDTALSSGATVYKDRASTAASNASLGATSIVVNRVPWPIVGGAFIYTGTQVIETTKTVLGSNGQVTIAVKPLQAAITASDVLIFDRTIRDVVIQNSHIEGFRTGLNLEGGSDGTPENVLVKFTRFHRNGVNDILVEGGAAIGIDRCAFDKGNRALDTSNGSNIRFSGTPANVSIANSTFERLFDSKVRFNIYLNTLAAAVKITGNTFADYDATLSTPSCIFAPAGTLGAMLPLIENNHFGTGLTAIRPTTVPMVGSTGGIMRGFGSAAPTSGTWPAGSILFDVLGTGFWQCTAAGTPGTWTRCDTPCLPLAGGTMSGAVVMSIAGGGSSHFIARGEGTTAFYAERYSANASQAELYLRKARGTIASPAAVDSNDVIGHINFAPHSGSGFVSSGVFRMICIAGTPSATDLQMQANIRIAASGAVSATDALTIDHTTGLQLFGANVVVDPNRHFRFRQYAHASLPSQDSGDTIASSDTRAALTSDGTEWLSGGVIRARAVTNDTTVSIPPGYAIVAIVIENTTANAITGGLKIGTTSGATDVLNALAVGANAKLYVADAAILLRWFSRSAAQTLHIQDVTAWNSASLEMAFLLSKVF